MSLRPPSDPNPHDPSPLGAGRADLIRLSEIARGAPAGVGQRLRASLPEGRVVLRGTRDAVEVPSGLTINAHDAQAQEDFEVRALRPAGVVLHLVLAGRVEASLGGVPMELSRRPGGPVPVVLSALAEPLEFHRLSRRGEALRKLTLRISWDWLERRGIPRAQILQGAPRRDARWSAGPEDIADAEALMHPAPGGPQCLLREARSAALVGRAFEQLWQAGERVDAADRDRLNRMEHLGCAPGPVPPLDEIARSGGMSLSSARRLFHRVHGQSILARLRELRLTRAHDALRHGASVAGAAWDAGYDSPSAFATAFRKWCGQSPSQVRDRAAPR
ncbi:helix-turn-helix domain-containing protein [Pseudooceanicola sp. 200-1SW]|uniref:helix-turn-helix transcriptional regulator n=1 Tax=Pseudooceanicola sp. 200-1SW TaxID=3425949 RepID=UPI003D7F5522